MHRYSFFTFFMFLILVLAPVALLAQRDSVRSRQSDKALRVTVADSSAIDTGKVKKKRSEPGKAALRSAIIPGWGQIYNKKYWKLPIVYGALAVPVVTFSYNLTWYRKTREAYNIKYHNDTITVTPPLPEDQIDPRLQPLSTESLRLYRNEFRQNMDFSVLAFLVIWGLQVADAAVDAHLRSFNISDDLSMKIKPMVSPGRSSGVSFVFAFRDHKQKGPYTGF